MTQDEIIRMAREAGMTVFVIESLERFAALVAAHEREACAKVCETDELCCKCGDECAEAIRAIKFEGDTGFRPVAEMIAEHKQDPKKAAAIEKAKMRKAEQKPFCYHDGRNIVGKEFADHSDVFPLYTAPPPRQWHGLTEEDLFDIAIVNFGEPDLQLFIEMGKLVQEELKEKNA